MVTSPQPLDGPQATPRSHLVTAFGELDLATAPALADDLRRAAAGDPDGLVLVDLNRVTFIDCSGLGPLLRARNALGSRLRLRNPSPQVVRLLSLADLAEAFSIELDPAATDDARAGEVVVLPRCSRHAARRRLLPRQAVRHGHLRRGSGRSVTPWPGPTGSEQPDEG